MEYSAIASVLLFILLARTANKIHIAILAGLTVGLPFLLTGVILSIRYGFDAALSHSIQPSSLITIALQYVVAVIIFRGIKEKGDDNLTTYFAWVAVGWPLIFIFVPWLIGQIG